MEGFVEGWGKNIISKTKGLFQGRWLSESQVSYHADYYLLFGEWRRPRRHSLAQIEKLLTDKERLPFQGR